MVSEFTCKGYRHNDSLISIEQVFGGINVGINISHATFILDLGEDKIDQIKQNMNRDYDLPKLQVFCDSATIIEPIGRFISLYTLMLHYCSDDQKKLDEAILSIDSTVAQYKSPRGKYHETVFTKIRNELSHKRDGVNMIETHNQARANVDRLEHIVRSYILSTI